MKKVLILADNLVVADRIFSAMKGIVSCDFDFVVCKKNRLKLSLQYLYHNPQKWFRLLFLLFGGRGYFLNIKFGSPRYISWQKGKGYWLGLHAMGVIYRQNVIELFERGILNAHIGILPRYRGRSVVEWSLLEGNSIGVSVFFIDSGIDTGKEIISKTLVSWRRGDFSSVDALKSHLFRMDGLMYRSALEYLISGSASFEENNHGVRYYPVSQLFKKSLDEYISTQLN